MYEVISPHHDIGTINSFIHIRAIERVTDFPWITQLVSGRAKDINQVTLAIASLSILWGIGHIHPTDLLFRV